MSLSKRAVPVPALTFVRAPDTLFDRLSTLATHQTTFWVTVAAAVAIIWIAPRPPMTDLPQHVAQIVHMKELLAGTSPWVDDLRLNFLTVYLLGYLLALLLAYVVSATIAIKLVLTGAFVAFVVSLRQWRRDRGGDARLDVLFVPGFFGFAYDFGFFPFLVAAPVAVQMMRLGARYAELPTPRDAVLIAACGALLLVSHGLMFLFAGLVAGIMLIAHARSLRGFAVAAWPYAGLLALCAAYMSVVSGAAGAAAWSSPEWWTPPVARVISVFLFTQSAFDIALVPLVLAIACAACIAGQRIHARAAMPLAVVVALLLLLPDSAMSADYINGRFALFVLPFLALCFRKPDEAHTDTQLARTAAVLLVLLCWTGIGIKAWRTAAFAAEAQDFEQVLAAAEPARRATSALLIGDPKSAAASHAGAYLYFATWYEVEKRGFVDFSFATFPPQIVRFKSVTGWQRVTDDDRSKPQFDWSRATAVRADYYFVRKAGGRWPSSFIDHPRCTLSLLRETGTWGLFQRGACAATSQVQ